MEDPSRIEKLEERMASLEASLEEVRDALAVRARLDRPPIFAGRETPTTREAPAASLAEEPPLAAQETLFESFAAIFGLRRREKLDRKRDLETWLGQNALLVVGVLALIAAVAYTLKYAFDQGWVSPAARVGAGLVAGLAIAVYGERLIRRGMGRFGAGLQGAGAAIAYLSVWAAAGPFQFVPSGVGIVALAVVSGLVLLSAIRNSEEYLAGLAAVGAFLAPILLGDSTGTGNVLLAYSLIVAGAGAAVAAIQRWQPTYVVVLLGFFAMAMFADEPRPAFLGLYLTIGGGALATLALWLDWKAHALLILLLAWIGVLLWTQWFEGWEAWTLVAGPAALAWPLYSLALKASGDARSSGIQLFGSDTLSQFLTLAFYATALAWAVAATEAVPSPLDQYPLTVAAFIGLLFLVPGVMHAHVAMHVAGLIVLATGIVAQWQDGVGLVFGLSGLAVLAAVTSRSGPLTANRWTTLALGVLAAWALFEANATLRPEGDPALVSTWSIALNVLVASLVLIAGPLWTSVERKAGDSSGFNLRTVIWVLAAAIALGGGTIEVPAFVTQQGGTELAAGLAVSSYWLLFAAGLLAYGFWKDVRGVRIAGLAVAALSVGKVLFVDMAELQALYRVGSLALLAVITLAAARAYYRREASSAGPGE